MGEIFIFNSGPLSARKYYCHLAPRAGGGGSLRHEMSRQSEVGPWGYQDIYIRPRPAVGPKKLLPPLASRAGGGSWRREVSRLIDPTPGGIKIFISGQGPLSARETRLKSAPPPL
jgi:hypothetical protein